jgi:hypothetical protein
MAFQGDQASRAVSLESDEWNSIVFKGLPGKFCKLETIGCKGPDAIAVDGIRDRAKRV